MIVYKRVQYRSLRSLAWDYGINYKTLRDRLKRGLSMKEALNPITKENMHRITYNGKLYKCKKDICEDYGCSRTVVYKCLKNKIPIESVSRQIEYKGIKYPSLRQLAFDFGIKYTTLYKRVKVLGMELEQALIDFNPACIPAKDHKGNTYKSLRDMAKAYNLNYVTFFNRLQRGYTIERALTQPVRKIKKVKNED